MDQSQALNNHNEGSRGANSHVLTLSESTSSSHENETVDTMNVPRPESIQAMLSGLTSYQLSWGESIRVNQTPKVSRPILHKIFGGHACTDWVKCNRDVGYPRMFCAKNTTAQPFVPASTGTCGLALLEPAWVDSQDEFGNHIFPVFVSTGPAVIRDTQREYFEYIGDYTIVILPQKNIDWSLLPAKVEYS